MSSRRRYFSYLREEDSPERSLSRERRTSIDVPSHVTSSESSSPTDRTNGSLQTSHVYSSNDHSTFSSTSTRFQSSSSSSRTTQNPFWESTIRFRNINLNRSRTSRNEQLLTEATDRSRLGRFREPATSSSSSSRDPSPDVHEWLHLFKPTRRDRRLIITDDDVTNVHDQSVFLPVPLDGYSNIAYTKTLFPPLSDAGDKIAIMDLLGMEEAINFRKHASVVRRQTMTGNHVARVHNELIERGNPAKCLAPPYKNGKLPVLYQVVARNGDLLILEAKDALVPGSRYPELQFIVLDEQAVNIVSLSGKSGFDPSFVSMKDFIYVYELEPTPSAILDPRNELNRSKNPKLLLTDGSSRFFFQAKLVGFVEPPVTKTGVMGFVINLEGSTLHDDNTVGRTRRRTAVHEAPTYVRNITAAFAGSPHPVVIDINRFPDLNIQTVKRGDLLLADVRQNTTSSIRFSEEASSEEAKEELHRWISTKYPSIPHEGILPLNVYKPSEELLAEVRDRLGPFDNYDRDRHKAIQLIIQLISAGTSAIAAYDICGQNKKIYTSWASVSDQKVFPLSLQVEIPEFTLGHGWDMKRTVSVWVEETLMVFRTSIAYIRRLNPKRSLLRLEVYDKHKPLFRELLDQMATRQGTSMENLCFQVKCRIEDLNEKVDIMKDIIASDSLQSLPDSTDNSIEQVLDSIYSKKFRPSHRLAIPLMIEDTVQLGEETLQLNHQQKQVLVQASKCPPTLFVNGVFGSGKTIIASLIAGTFALRNKQVLVISSTKSAVKVFAEKFSSISQLKDLKLMHYSNETHFQTNVNNRQDYDNQLLVLGEQFELEGEDRETWQQYVEMFQLLQELQENRMTARFSEESDKLGKTSALFTVLRNKLTVVYKRLVNPHVVCMTASSFIFHTRDKGNMENWFNSFSVVIFEEASTISECMFLAFLNSTACPMFVFCGDTHMFPPFVRAPHDAYQMMVKSGACSSMCMASGPVSIVRLNKSFRSHPMLNELPRLVSYGDELEDDVTHGERSEILHKFPFSNPSIPFCLVDVNDLSTHNEDTGSHYNDGEAELCERLVDSLMRLGVHHSNILVLCCYLDQKKELQECLEDRVVDLSTVDASMQKTAEVVILLTTRNVSEHLKWNPVFLEYKSRLTVSLTRSRSALFVLGSVNKLRYLKGWREVVQYAERNNALVAGRDGITRLMGDIRH